MDIDVDIAPNKRPAILKKARKKRGEYRVLQVCTYGTEKTKSAILAAARGYRSKEYPNGIDSDVGQYLSSLIEQERGFVYSIGDTVFGNEEKKRPPNKRFVEEVSKYPGLLDIMIGIEGLINKRGVHASGVIKYNQDPWKTNAIMKSPSGDLITQLALHQSEYCGDTKFDWLATEVTSKMINAIELLQRDGLIDASLSIREAYDKYLHPDVIDPKDPLIWDAIGEGSVIDCFQFDGEVGTQAAKLIKPKDPMQATMCNALMRLMAEKGEERPLDRYFRMKSDISLWYREARQAGITEEEIKILEKYYLPYGGTPCLQENLMTVLMEPEISAFTLKESNDARKIVGKKQMERIPELREKFFNTCKNPILAGYVWKTILLPQLG